MIVEDQIQQRYSFLLIFYEINLNRFHYYLTKHKSYSLGTLILTNSFFIIGCFRIDCCSLENTE